MNGSPSVISGPAPIRHDVDACILDQVQLRAFDRILCLECGDGWVVEEAWRRARRGYACGVDRSEALIEQANISRAVPGGIEFKTWDGMHVPYPDQWFHVAMALFAPAGSLDLVDLLAEIQRVLQRGGVMHFVDASGTSANGAQPFSSELMETLARAGFRQGSVESGAPSPDQRRHGVAPVRTWYKALAK